MKFYTITLHQVRYFFMVNSEGIHKPDYTKKGKPTWGKTLVCPLRFEKMTQVEQISPEDADSLSKFDIDAKCVSL